MVSPAYFSLLEKYLEAFCAKDFEKMFQMSTLTWQSQNSVEAIRSLLEGRDLSEFIIKEISPVNNSGAGFFAVVTLKVNGDWHQAERVMIITEKAPYSPLTLADPVLTVSHTGINPVSLLRLTPASLQPQP